MVFTYGSVLSFWFESLTPKQWWQVDEALDAKLREEFGELHRQASCGELFHWRESAKGRLAEIIILDQFSRNIYRNTADAFRQDPMALILAQEMVHLGLDKSLSEQERAFCYMPYMHSESKVIHLEAVKLFSQPGLSDNLEFEHQHKNIIDRFGRYPHRNAILGRTSTEAELEFLKQPGSSF